MTLECIDCKTGYDYAEAIAKKLEMDIKFQGLEDGDRLMPVRQLTQKYETSYLTMRKAINLLADKGLLSSRQGSGVYVTESKSLSQPNPTRKKLTAIYCGYEKYITAMGIYTDLLYGAEREAAECNVEISASLLLNPQELIKRDLYSSSDGFLLLGNDMPGLADTLKDKSAVWMMGNKKGWGDFVSYDNRLVGVAAAEELVSAGRKNLVCINVESENGDERCRAFNEHAESLGANVIYLNNPEAMIRTRYNQHIDFDALGSWVDRIENGLPGLNGVFVVDLVAAPLCTALKERGIRLGKDIEIATSNWHDYVVGGTQYQPINILLHPKEVGAMAVRQLLWRIKHPDARQIAIRLEPEVEKASRRCISKPSGKTENLV